MPQVGTGCLIVDDSVLMRKLASSMMAALGFSCREAQDGQAALSACAQDMPNVVLLDWSMPSGMDGMEFLRQLKAMQPAVMPKIVFISAHNTLSDIQAALDAGADEYIMKPFDSDILKRKLEDAGALVPS